jgi:hypothetical protein
METRCPKLSQAVKQGGGFLEKPPKAKYLGKKFEKIPKWGTCYMKSMWPHHVTLFYFCLSFVCCMEIISSEHDQGLAQSSWFHVYSQNYLRRKTSFTKQCLEVVCFVF